jgi:penicillin-binding protein 1A
MNDTSDSRSSGEPFEPTANGSTEPAAPRQPWTLDSPPDGFATKYCGDAGAPPPPDRFDDGEPPEKPPVIIFGIPMRKILFVVSWVALGVVAICAVAAAIYVFVLMRGLPSIAELQHYTPPITTRVYAGDGTVLGEYARERRVFVPIAFVPKKVVDAFTSAEDRNFFSHPGIDPSGIMRAAIKDIGKVMAGRRPEGASTITQQVARNFLLNSDVKIARKIREVLLALRIEEGYSKEKILELYLNEINLGQNSYGVASAALNYFGKSLDELDTAEVAFLAALPKAPSHYDPRFHYQAAVDRRNWVIRQMEENGYISRAEADAAQAEPLIANTRALGSQTEDADYFVEEVRRLLYAKYGQKTLYEGGLQVRSSLDTRLQNYAVNALRTGLVRYDRRHGWRGAKDRIDASGDWAFALRALGNKSGIETWRRAVALGYSADKSIRIGLSDGGTAKIPSTEYQWARPELEGAEIGAAPAKPQDVVKVGDVFYVEQVKGQTYGLRQVPEVNGAIVAMDPHTGRVLALSGGFSFASSQFDRAMQALRQPGSAFKPFVYAAALENGFTPASLVLDAPFCTSQGEGMPMWCPENFEKKFIGLATLRRGIELSKNLMTVRLAQAVGMNKIAPLAETFGVYDRLGRLLANSLGSTGATLLRVTTGYAEFVNGGKKITPSLIDRIQDREGKTIWRHDPRDCRGCNGEWKPDLSEPLLDDNREQLLDPRTAYQIVSMLQGVVQRGTGASVGVVGKPLGGKTGTSNESRDVWFVGFSPDLAAGVYVGFDVPRTLGAKEQGATVAAPIFRDFMKGALAGVPPTQFRIPPGIEMAPIDRMTGQPAEGGFMEAFKAGTAPGDPGAPPQIVIGGDVPEGIGGGDAPHSSGKIDEGTGGLY